MIGTFTLVWSCDDPLLRRGCDHNGVSALGRSWIGLRRAAAADGREQDCHEAQDKKCSTAPPSARQSKQKDTTRNLRHRLQRSIRGPLVRLLLCGCGGVVLTVSDACPVPVIDFGFTKHADWVRLDGMVQAKLIGVV